MPRAWADVDLGAIRHNVRSLRALVSPAELCAVVKADGYGHGAAPVARAALEAGATWLAVALPEEGVALRDTAIDAPILLLSEPRREEMELVVGHTLRPTVYTEAGVVAAAKAAAAVGLRAPLPVHLKVDTGMHRVGAPPERALDLARVIGSHGELVLEGLWTHCAVADEPDNPFTGEQLARFDAVVGAFEAAGIRPPVVHAANSAAAIAHPASRYDLVRCGIAIYGLDPSPALDGLADLRPAMTLRSTVSFVKEVAAGERISYGLRHTFPETTVVATVPIGYADGVRRRLSDLGAEVLIGGRRCPIVGTITMDQLMVDCGPGADVHAGDDVVLLGEQGGECIAAREWAERLDTIEYEVVCDFGPRVQRCYR